MRYDKMVITNIYYLEYFYTSFWIIFPIQETMNIMLRYVLIGYLLHFLQRTTVYVIEKRFNIQVPSFNILMNEGHCFIVFYEWNVPIVSCETMVEILMTLLLINCDVILAFCFQITHEEIKRDKSGIVISVAFPMKCF